VIQSALNDPAALTEADSALARAPESVEGFLVRARVRRRSGNRQSALLDVESGLALVPGDPRFLELRGLLKTELGRPESALIDLDQALSRGARGSIRMARARALTALKRYDDAMNDWSLAAEFDPEDPRIYQGRARSLLRMGLTDRALVDLEQAADWAADNPALLAPITLTYASCLAARPDRFPRVIQLGRRTWLACRTVAREITAQ
jgi:tetratricopeptide (TPR) repeat protein